MELESLIYWNLSSTDLVDYDENADRKYAKYLLKTACCLLSGQQQEHRILRNTIAALAEFDVHNRVSGACLLEVKVKFTSIMRALKNLYKEDDVMYNLSKSVWKSVMYHFNLHHHSCPHTRIMIENSEPRYKTHFANKVCGLAYESLRMNNYAILTVSDMNELYKSFRPYQELKSGELNLLFQHLNHIYAEFSRLFSYHLVNVGICYAEKSTVIEMGHVRGFFNSFRRLLTLNNMKITVLDGQSYNNTRLRDFVVANVLAINSRIHTSMSKSGKLFFSASYIFFRLFVFFSSLR